MTSPGEKSAVKLNRISVTRGPVNECAPAEEQSPALLCGSHKNKAPLDMLCFAHGGSREEPTKQVP